MFCFFNKEAQNYHDFLYHFSIFSNSFPWLFSDEFPTIRFSHIFKEVNILFWQVKVRTKNKEYNKQKYFYGLFKSYWAFNLFKQVWFLLIEQKLRILNIFFLFISSVIAWTDFSKIHIYIYILMTWGNVRILIAFLIDVLRLVFRFLFKKKIGVEKKFVLVFIYYIIFYIFHYYLCSIYKILTYN